MRIDIIDGRLAGLSLGCFLMEGENYIRGCEILLLNDCYRQ